MDIIRRNTDYAFRILAELVKTYDQQQALSARHLSTILHIPYPITCKLLQKFNDKKITTSIMGPKGGYLLARPPSQISFLEAIETIQGPIYINRCFLRSFQCPLQQQCPLHKKLEKIQDDIVSALKSTTFEEIRDRKETELG